MRRAVTMLPGSSEGGIERGDTVLSVREWQVAEYVFQGMQNPAIASRINRSVDTVKTHKANIKKKLNCTTMPELYECLKELFSRPLPAPDDHRALTGIWLSRFLYESQVPGSSPPRFRTGVQINLEEIVLASPPFTHSGKCICGVRKDGGEAYVHTLSFLLKNRMAIGIWDNDNSPNAGCFQLLVFGRSQAMAGAHLGNTSGPVVKSGDWVWVKLASSAGIPPAASMRPFEELDTLVTASLEQGGEISLAQVLR